MSAQYTQLVAQIAQITHRDDLTPQMPNFVGAANELINVRLSLSNEVPTTANDANEILAGYPNLYLYASLISAYEFTNEIDMAQHYIARYENEVERYFITAAGGISPTLVMGADPFYGTSSSATGVTFPIASTNVATIFSGSGFSRNLQQNLDDRATVTDFGAIGNGVADDTAAVQSAQALSYNYYVPVGLYSTTLPFNGTGAFSSGAGNLTTVDGGIQRKRANTILNITSAPVFDDGGGIINDFQGEFKSPLNTQMSVTGALTVGDPVAGDNLYLQHAQTSGKYTRAYFSSGKNTKPYTNADRTGWAMNDNRLSHFGKGDATCNFSACFVAQADPDILLCQGQPAAVLYNGQVSAGDDTLILNPFEILLQDNGYDVVGKGVIVNLTRDNHDEDESQFWVGSRMQSIGTQPAGSAFQAVGAFDAGLDLTGMVGSVGIALEANQEIHFDADHDWHLPCPQWITAETVAIGTYRYNLQKVYISISAGTTGATAPTGTGTGINDGGVTWDFEADNSFIKTAAVFPGTKMEWDGTYLQTYVKGVPKLSVGQSLTTIHDDLVIDTTRVNMPGLPTFADETAAASLATGDLYQTATGELRIKL